jgi:two-component sensor histidine kinase
LDAQARVLTIAKVHDQLWRRNEVENLDLAEFLQELCVQLRASTGPNHTIACEVEPTTVNTDQAVSLGLIVNELVTNAIKYAYPGGAGEVRLSVRRLQQNCLRLEVCDRGMGLPAGFETARSKSLGLKLIVSLVRQLGGRAEWQDAQPGTRFVLEFPHSEFAH